MLTLYSHNYAHFHTSHTFLLPLLQTMAEREALEQEAQQQQENEKKRLQERKVGGRRSAAWRNCRRWLGVGKVGKGCSAARQSQERAAVVEGGWQMQHGATIVRKLCSCAN